VINHADFLALRHHSHLSRIVLRMSRFTTGHKFYVFGRGAATALSFVFALLYSKELGVINRSYLVVIMTSSVLIAVTLTSGTTLTLRNLGSHNTSKDTLSSFSSMIAIEALIGIVVFWITMLVFSILKYPIHPTLFTIALLYFGASVAHLVVFELLIAFTAFKFLATSEIFTIILQIGFFFMIGNFFDVSIASKVLFSFILAYSGIVASGLIYLKHNCGYSVSFGKPLIFFRLAKGNHTLGSVLGIVDRFDRLIIAWFLPLSLLGKYAVMSSAISLFRFFPEAFSKLIVATKSEAWRKYLQTKYIWVVSFVLLTIAVLLLQSIIEIVLGPNWLLPISISYVFALQELARGMFQVTGNYNISIGKSGRAHSAALYLLAITGPAAYVLSLFIGLIGVPLGFLLSYVFVLLLLREKKQSV